MKRLAICVLVSYLAFCSQASGQGGIIRTVAGSDGIDPGYGGYSGDGGPATSALLNFGNGGGVAVDASGNLFIADTFNNRIRKVSANGIITTVAGNGPSCALGDNSCGGGFSGDGGPATSASLSDPWGVAVDAFGNLFIADRFNNRIRKVSANGIITTVAGTGGFNFSGDGGPATSALIQEPSGVAVDASGNLFIADTANYRIRKVSAKSGIITSVAGGGTQDNSGDGGPATSAFLQPTSVAVDASGSLFVTDDWHNSVRKVSASGIITTVAGNGNYAFSGDGGPATSAALFRSYGVAVSASGNLFIADTDNYRIREVSASGTITTVAGGGTGGLGDGGPATAASLSYPNGVAVDASGNLFIADTGNNRIRKVSASASTYTCTNTTSPVITFVDSASGYGGYSYFASGSWLEIKGTNLADPADPRFAGTGSAQWASGDFNGVNSPTMLDSISVSINGKPAYVWYLSPTQLNVQAPEDSTIGNVAITVTNCKATSSPFMFTRQALAPGFLAPSSYSANGTQYMIATFASDGAYVLNTSTGAAFGLNSRPAKPGDLIFAYGIGFGDVTPSILPGVIAGQSNSLVNPVTVSFGSAPATLSYSGLAGGYVGLYEFFITVPPGLADGDYQINATQNGKPVPQTVYLTVDNQSEEACSGYSYSATATIHHQYVAANASNYTATIVGTWPALATAGSGGQVTNANGYDICFANAANTARLNWELESYNGATGAIVAHVLVGSISSVDDTTLSIYFGNSSISTLEGGSTGSAWDSVTYPYAGIWHLGDGTTLNGNDSSFNANTLTNHGATATSGEIDGAAGFASAYMAAPASSSLDFSGAVSFSFWENPSSLENLTPVLASRTNCNTGNWQIYDNVSGGLYFNFWSGSAGVQAFTRTLLSTGVWSYVVVTYDGSNARFYVNGSLTNTVAMSGTRDSGANVFNIGTDGCGNYVHGSLDEVRIAQGAWPPTLIQTMYNNQSAPSKFVTISGGTPVNQSSAPTGHQ